MNRNDLEKYVSKKTIAWDTSVLLLNYKHIYIFTLHMYIYVCVYSKLPSQNASFITQILIKDEKTFLRIKYKIFCTLPISNEHPRMNINHTHMQWGSTIKVQCCNHIFLLIFSIHWSTAQCLFYPCKYDDYGPP